MLLKLAISEDARLDILDAFLWYEQQREGLGLDFELSLDAGFSLILRKPNSQQMKYENVRVHFIRKFPYGIHYFVDGDTIRVIGVFHTSRNPMDWFSRK